MLRSNVYYAILILFVLILIYFVYNYLHRKPSLWQRYEENKEPFENILKDANENERQLILTNRIIRGEIPRMNEEPGINNNTILEGANMIRRIMNRPPENVNDMNIALGDINFFIDFIPVDQEDMLLILGDILPENNNFVGAQEQNIIEARKTDAAQKSENKQAEINNYLNLSKQHTNDAQNVHDPLVNICIKNIVKIIKDNQGDVTLPDFNKIANKIITITSPKNITTVERVLMEISKGGNLYNIQLSDKEILQRIYLRIYDPRNIKNRNKLLQALSDALVDCYQHDHVECVTGRVSRILGCLTLLDFDKACWEINRTEHMQNEAIDEIKVALIRKQEELSKIGDTTGIRNAAKTYLAKTKEDYDKIGPYTDEDDEMVKSSLRDIINKKVDEQEQIFKDYPNTFNKFRLEMLAAI